MAAHAVPALSSGATRSHQLPHLRLLTPVHGHILNALPMEVWHLYRVDLVGILARVYLAIGQLGCTPVGSLAGDIHLFHKFGDRAEQCIYRPICLLNSDYRLSTKILAAHLGPLLAHTLYWPGATCLPPSPAY